MEQTAIVKRVLPQGVAEVSLLRRLECGLSCKNCDGCVQKPKEEVLVLANNDLGADVGALVTVCPNHGGTRWAASLLFLLPCACLIVGYMLAQWLGLPQGICIITAFLGLTVGFIPALLVNASASKKDKPEFTIVSLRR